MQFKLNCSPHLKMHEITKKLFDNKFLSDVQFSVDGKIIHAHSLELMKRSEVFEKQFEDTSCGEKKLIPINDYRYEIFFEFVRFLYTDECKINDENGIELLKLANKYKVISLENRLINLLDSRDWGIQLFEYYVTEKYEIVRHDCEFSIAFDMIETLNHKRFLSFHPDVVNAVLQLEEVEEGTTEIQIFNAVAKWIDTYCKRHQMSLAEGRQKFDQLIRKVRFATMLPDEIRDCAKNYPGLLSDSDCVSIAKQIVFGADTVWISKPRSNYVYKGEWREINKTETFETKCSVSKDTILNGLWIGVEANRKEIEIEITSKNTNTNENEKVQVTQSAPGYWDVMLVSLGDSIRLRPHFEYTIAVKYLEITDKDINVSCRKKTVNVFYNNPDNSIQTINASDNMFEIFFKSAPE